MAAVGWRGGQVMVSNGTPSQARQVFEQWKASGDVRYLSAKRAFV